MSILNNTTSLQALLAKANLLSDAESVRPSEYPSLSNSILNNTARLRYLLEQATGLPVGEGGEQTKAAGLYEADGVMLASWDELVNNGLDVTKDYTSGSSFSDSSSMFNIINNVDIYSNPNYTGGYFEIVIPEGVTSIGDYAFYMIDLLVSVVIPNTVESIGDHAFEDSYLMSVSMGNSVKSIGDFAFSDLTLPSITLPDGLTSIGMNAFKGCYKLTSITIPNSVTSIGDYAFSGCGNLSSVYFEHTATPTFSNGCFYTSSGSSCTFYFRNITVANAFTGGTSSTSHYHTKYGTKSTNYNW